MFEDLAQSALAVYLFILSLSVLTWVLSPLAASWETARMRMSPRSLEDRLTEQSLVGPVILLGTVGFVVSGTTGWAVGSLLEGFDPVRFNESWRHINIFLISTGVFVLTAYLANTYARYGSGKPTNLGEKLYELQNGDRGFYATQHMDEAHWLALREQITGPWKQLRRIDEPLLAALLGDDHGEEPWELMTYQRVQELRSAHGALPTTDVERRLARRWWARHRGHWISIALLGLTITVDLVLAIDSADIGSILFALGALALGAVLVPPLILRSTRARNRVRTAVLARNLFWTRRAVKLIDAELQNLRTPAAAGLKGSGAHQSWAELARAALAKLTGATPDATERPARSVVESAVAPSNEHLP